ncbi:hypothetical protein PVAG01_01828 [Phlyctema vagabunda]|uniref:Uncharacterized protein n=1 Tax=Phlyctema vagabunda TaxID=108571 RepID=A0ABR4PYI2_9HELO
MARRLNDFALNALPYIGALVGVDAAVPSKAVYAIYDPASPGLRYVLGEGTFRQPEDVCFMKRFVGDTDSRAELASLQRLHFIELLTRSSVHYQALLSPDSPAAVLQRTQYPDVAAVAEQLTFISSLNLRSNGPRCPALQQITGPLQHNGQEIQDEGVPCILIASNPEWNFEIRNLPQPVPSFSAEMMLRLKYAAFNASYFCSISFPDFMLALYCLSGLLVSDFVRISETSNDDEAYHIAEPAHQSDRFRSPSGWTVDCFLARFDVFRQFVQGMGLTRVPNPLRWLEAELQDELRLSKQGYSLRQPWKGEVGNAGQVPIFTWEMLRDLNWIVPMIYPQRCTAVETPHPHVQDVFSGSQDVQPLSSPPAEDHSRMDIDHDAQRSGGHPRVIFSNPFLDDDDEDLYGVSDDDKPKKKAGGTKPSDSITSKLLAQVKEGEDQLKEKDGMADTPSKVASTLMSKMKLTSPKIHHGPLRESSMSHVSSGSSRKRARSVAGDDEKPAKRRAIANRLQADPSSPTHLDNDPRQEARIDSLRKGSIFSQNGRRLKSVAGQKKKKNAGARQGEDAEKMAAPTTDSVSRPDNSADATTQNEERRFGSEENELFIPETIKTERCSSPSSLFGSESG